MPIILTSHHRNLLIQDLTEFTNPQIVLVTYVQPLHKGPDFAPSSPPLAVWFIAEGLDTPQAFFVDAYALLEEHRVIPCHEVDLYTAPTLTITQRQALLADISNHVGDNFIPHNITLHNYQEPSPVLIVAFEVSGEHANLVYNWYDLQNETIRAVACSLSPEAERTDTYGCFLQFTPGQRTAIREAVIRLEGGISIVSDTQIVGESLIVGYMNQNRYRVRVASYPHFQSAQQLTFYPADTLWNLADTTMLQLAARWEEIYPKSTDFTFAETLASVLTNKKASQ
jgi:hypothetical protein